MLYPELEPYDSGLLAVGTSDQIYWEVCGNPQGKPALVLHGGPGSGCSPWHRRLFDPASYKVVLFDQRNCGRSLPHASGVDVDLSDNTTVNLVSDIENLRLHLGIESFLVLGGSWGCTLALAYAESHPQCVSELILFGITTGHKGEIDWLFRGGLARLLPEQWNRLVEALPPSERGSDVVEAYYQLLSHPDPVIRRSAAQAWCLWESATPDWPPSDELAQRFKDDAFSLAFARIVTHYMHHDLWLEDGSLIRNAGVLANTPGTLINGRFDFQAPLENAWELKRAWPRAELIVVDDAGHSAASPGISGELVRATNRYAQGRQS